MKPAERRVTFYNPVVEELANDFPSIPKVDIDSYYNRVQSAIEYIFKRHGDNREAMEVLRNFPEISIDEYGEKVKPIFKSAPRSPSTLFCYTHASDKKDVIIQYMGVRQEDPEIFNAISVISSRCLEEMFRQREPSRSTSPSEFSSLQNQENSTQNGAAQHQ